jgi:hypothetical protein
MNSTNASSTLQDLLSAFSRYQTRRRSLRIDHCPVNVQDGDCTSSQQHAFTR